MIPNALSSAAGVPANWGDIPYVPETTQAMLRADFAIYDGSIALWSGAGSKIVRADGIDHHLKMILGQDYDCHAIPDSVRTHLGSLHRSYEGRPDILGARRLSALAAFFISLHADAAFDTEGQFDKTGLLHFVRKRLPGAERQVTYAETKYAVFNAIQRVAGQVSGIMVNGTEVLKTPSGALFFTDVPRDALREPDLPNVAVLQKHLCDLDFVDADLSGARFQGCTFQNVNFDKANLSNATFSRCSFGGTHFVDATMRQTQFTDCFLDTCQFLRCEMPQAKFIGTCVGATTIHACNMRKVIIGRLAGVPSGPRVALNSVQINACDLRRATIDGVDWNRGGFTGSMLDSAVVKKSSFAHMSWKGIIGESATAESAVLSRNSFRFCELGYLTMTASRWLQCEMRDCHLDSLDNAGGLLEEMVIADTTMRGVDFSGNQVTKLSVSDGTLISVSFSDARITDTSFAASPTKRRLNLRLVDFQSSILQNMTFERCDIHMPGEQLRQVFSPESGPN